MTPMSRRFGVPEVTDGLRLSRRAVLGAGAVGGLAAGLLGGTALPAHADAPDEDGYDLWLRYRRVSDAGLLRSYRAAFRQVMIIGDDPLLDSASAELSRGLSGLLGREIKIINRSRMADVPSGSVVIGTDLTGRSGAGTARRLAGLGDEGFAIRRIEGSNGTVISSIGARGVLYGVFRFLQQLQRQRAVDRLDLTDQPVGPIRMLDHWDNLDRTIERGYAGKSIFYWDDLPELRPRYTDYARVLASVGINHSVINNVNANAEFLSSDRLSGLAGLASVLRS